MEWKTRRKEIGALQKFAIFFLLTFAENITKFVSIIDYFFAKLNFPLFDLYAWKLERLWLTSYLQNKLIQQTKTLNKLRM
jgi:hypothetical protein